ncbi:hypothetical protein V6N13_071271 [Hibiscus sabdariffa]
MGFLKGIQDQPQSHHFLIELSTYSPMEDGDFDPRNVYDFASDEEIDCNLRDGVEIRRCSCSGFEDAGGWSFDSGCDSGVQCLIKFGFWREGEGGG